jgi:hypothetical protein
MLGDLRVKMKVGRRAKRRLDITIALYAVRMRAREIKFTVSLAKTGFSVGQAKLNYLY